MKVDIDGLINRTGEACKVRGWSKNWAPGGCYLHLEVSEFIEALRGKGDILDESADVMICFFALLAEYGVTGDMLAIAIEKKLREIEEFKVGDGKIPT